MTSATLADLANISRAAISQFENGHATPHPEVGRNLAEILHVRPGYFLLPARAGASNVFFRSQASLTLRARLRGSRKIDRLADLLVALRESLRLPAVNFPPPFPGTDDPLFLQDDSIEQAARETRRFWGLGEGPISNIVWLLENNGAVISRMDFHERQMDSWSQWKDIDQMPLIVLNSDKASAVRSRFDVSHELGHLILHRFVPSVYWNTADAAKIREQQAHRFASAFLMPEDTFGSEVGFPSLNRFLALKPRWRTSIASMITRTDGLGLITDEHAKRLWQSLSRRHWRTWEPLDDSMAPEQPRLLPRAFAVLREMDQFAPARLVDEAELNPEEIATLAMLPHDFFDAGAVNIIPFRRGLSDHS
ncbi:MAG: ImmA/IrrE family metallo-endopeptidase [Chloroflexi bacterium]|nr:ImmA/IrrE family metallo-endopeptidase [Chloroflexota bacterium]